MGRIIPKCTITVRDLSRHSADVSADMTITLPMEEKVLSEIIDPNKEYEIVDMEEDWAQKNISSYYNLFELNSFLKKCQEYDFGKLIVIANMGYPFGEELFNAFNSYFFFDGCAEATKGWKMSAEEKCARWLAENSLAVKLPEGVSHSIYKFDGVTPSILPKKVLDYIDWSAVWQFYENSGFNYLTSAFDDVEYLYKELLKCDYK